MQADKLGRVYALQETYLSKVYGWMTFGLAVTAGASLFTLETGLITYLMQHKWLFFGLLILELLLVIGTASSVSDFDPAAGGVLFTLYSALNGVTISSVFMIYTKSSIVHAFFMAAGMFVCTSIYGYATKRDLRGIGDFCMMALFGIIIAMVINIFIGSTKADYLISFITIVVFVGLTAYDTQRLREKSDPPVLAALSLYLDFINIFLHVLRLFGVRVGND